jgi:hypothetical protein
MQQTLQSAKRLIIELLERNKPTLVGVLKSYFPSSIPMLRRVYLKFRKASVEESAFGLPKPRLEQINTNLPLLEVTRNLPSGLENREHLLVVVLTDSNRFLNWFNFEESRNWDLWILDLCQANEFGKLADAEIKVEGFVTKTVLFSQLKQEILQSGYKQISFFDDDLETSVETINELFEFGSKYGFCLFQPALSYESEVNHENLRVVRTSAGYRSVPIVEIMCPFMRVDFYAEIANLSILAQSGWGFDIAISEIAVKTFFANPIVVDKLTVHHSRKSDPKNGEFYKYLSRNGIFPQIDLLRVNHFLGISPEETITRNITNINDFKNPTLIPGSKFDWKEVSKKGPNAKVAILMTKNEADILTLWVSHHIDFFDLMVILDDGSTDGSREFLEGNDFEGKLLLIKRDDSHGYIQREITTWLARFVSINAPEAIIFPLDTDEFLSESIIDGSIRLKPEDNFWWYKWKIATPIDNSDHEYTRQDLFLTESRDFAMCKIVVRSSLILKGYEIAQGNHNLELPGVKNSFHPHVAVEIPELIHVPVRSADQFKFKIAQGKRALKNTQSISKIEGFHWRGLSESAARSKEQIDIFSISANYLRLTGSKVLSRNVIRISCSNKVFSNDFRVPFKNL